jgi:hypothetical protein
MEMGVRITGRKKRVTDIAERRVELKFAALLTSTQVRVATLPGGMLFVRPKPSGKEAGVSHSWPDQGGA